MTTHELTELDGVVTLGCGPCRHGAGLPNRPGAPRQYYWCPTCQEEWSEPGPRDPIDPGLAVSTILWVTFLVGTLAVVMAFTTQGILDHGWISPTRDGISVTALFAMAVGFFTWVAVVTVLSQVIAGVLGGLARAVRFVWGSDL